VRRPLLIYVTLPSSCSAIALSTRPPIDSNTDLGSLDKDWRKLFHGENMPALRPQDIGAVPPPPPPPAAGEHYAVGRTVEIDLPFIGDGDFGKRMVTISKESNGEYLLSFFVEGAQRSETVDRAHLDLLVPPGGQQQDVGAGVGIAVPGGPANHGLFAVDMTDYNLCTQQSYGGRNVARYGRARRPLRTTLRASVPRNP
jgi:hypothetical protein